MWILRLLLFTCVNDSRVVSGGITRGREIVTDETAAAGVETRYSERRVALAEGECF